jgi:hypothetical protein
MGNYTLGFREERPRIAPRTDKVQITIESIVILVKYGGDDSWHPTKPGKPKMTETGINECSDINYIIVT